MKIGKFIKKAFTQGKLDFNLLSESYSNKNDYYNQYASNSDRIEILSNDEKDFDQFLTTFLSSTTLNLTMSTLKNILINGDNGQASEQASLFSIIQEKDSTISAHLQTRRLAMLSQGWIVECEDEKKRDELTKILEKAKFQQLLTHLTDALPTGYAGAGINWGKGGGTIESFSLIQPENWQFDYAGNPALIGADGNVYPLSNFHENQFIYTEYKLKPGIPTRGGLMRCLVWLYFFKHFNVRNRARFLEKFGTPSLMAILPAVDFDNKGQRSIIRQSLKSISADSVGIAKEGTEINPLTTNSQSNNADYKAFLDDINDSYAILILGQLASSDKAAGMSNGGVQSDVRKDLTLSDIRWLSEALTSSIAAPYEKFKYGTQGEIKIKLVYVEPEDEKKNAETVKILSEAGWEIEDETFMREKFNMPLVKVEKEKSQQIQQEKLTDLSLKDNNNDIEERKEHFINTLTENTLQELYDGNQSAMNEFYAPLKKSLSESMKNINLESETLIQDFEKQINKFYDKFPDIYNEMKGEKFQKITAGAFMSAILKGFTEK